MHTLTMELTGPDVRTYTINLMRATFPDHDGTPIELPGHIALVDTQIKRVAFDAVEYDPDSKEPTRATLTIDFYSK